MQNMYKLTEATTFMIFINIIMFVFLIAKSYSNRFIHERTIYKKVMFIYIVLFCIFSYYDSDWFSYLEIFQEMEKLYEFDWSIEFFFGKTDYSHMEKIYMIIAPFCFSNYLLFRLYIWGLATYSVFKIQSNLKLKFNQFIFIFLAVGLLFFCYGRVSLAYGLSFWGLTYLVKDDRNLISIIKGICLVLIATLFHKSAIIVIPIFAVSLFPLSKSKLLVALIFSIPLFFVANNMSSYLSLFQQDDSLMLSTLKANIEDGSGDAFSGSFIRFLMSKVFKYATFYVFVIYQLWLIVKNKYKVYPYNYRVLSTTVVYFTLLSSIFGIIGLQLMYYRVLLFALIPMICCLAYDYKIGNLKIIRSVCGLSLFYFSYKLSYMLYLSIVN